MAITLGRRHGPAGAATSSPHRSSRRSSAAAWPASSARSGSCWTVRPPSRSWSTAPAAGGVALAAGQSADIGLAAGDWLAGAARRLARGLVLTIDYGHPTADLYAPARREGTFLCYYRHTVNDEPYARVGRQDMTAHVDFGALERAGAAAGLTTLGLTTQAAFLIALGLGDLLVAQQ